MNTESPTIIAGQEKQQETVQPIVSAVPRIFWHMFLLALPVGIALGLVTEYFATQIVYDAIVSANQIPMGLVQQLLIAETSVMLAGVVLVVVLLRWIWVAPSWQATVIHASAIAFMILLAADITLGRINGMLYARELWGFLETPINLDSEAHLDLIASATAHVVVEGRLYQFVLWVLMSLVSVGTALLVLRHDPEKPIPERRDALGAIVMLFIPTGLVVSIFLNDMLFLALGSGINVWQEAFSIQDTLLTNAMISMPFVLLFITQVSCLIWLWKTPAELLHRRVIKFSAVLTAILTIIMALLYNWLIEGDEFHRAGLGVATIVCYMLFSWAYVVLAFRKGWQDNVNRVRASNVSLFTLIFGVSLLLLLLGYFVSYGILVNWSLYVVEHVVPRETMIEIADVTPPSPLEIMLVGLRFFAPVVGLGSIIMTLILGLVNLKKT